jgi:biopolymer transport protein ExbD
MTVKINKGSALGALSLTPLIDVVFLLLIFFLVASKFEEQERELNVVLPQASEARPLVSKPREMFVNVDQQGAYYVEGRKLTQEELLAAHQRAWTNNPGRQTVIIRADKRCDWEYVVAVMNFCNQAKIRDYRVMTAE